MLTGTLAFSSRLAAQCLVRADSIRPIFDAGGKVAGFVFPKLDAQKYAQLTNERVPALNKVVDGLKAENELLARRAQLQDTVVSMLQRNEHDLKSVGDKLNDALEKQSLAIDIQKSQLKAANREKWMWRGVAFASIAGLILK